MLVNLRMKLENIKEDQQNEPKMQVRKNKIVLHPNIMTILYKRMGESNEATIRALHDDVKCAKEGQPNGYNYLEKVKANREQCTISEININHKTKI